MNEFKIKNGLIVQGPMTATFAYTTASWAESASHLPNKQYTITASRADTASYLVPANNYSASKIHLGSGVVIEDYDLVGGQLGVPGLHVGTANLNINDKATIWSSGQADFIGVTSSLHGTASWADNASHARTASYLPVNTYKITSSWAETASLLDGLNIQNAGITLNTTKTPTVVMEMDTGSYLAAFFDYACASASNIRAGTIFGSWVGGNVTYAEVSNIDIGNTEQITMSVTINGAKVQLKSEAYSTTPWTIKALGRYI